MHFSQHFFKILHVLLQLADILFNQFLQMLFVSKHFSRLLQAVLHVEHTEIQDCSLPM